MKPSNMFKRFFIFPLRFEYALGKQQKAEPIPMRIALLLYVRVRHEKRFFFSRRTCLFGQLKALHDHA